MELNRDDERIYDMVTYKVILERTEAVTKNSLACIDEDRTKIGVVVKISDDRSYVILHNDEAYDMNRVTKVSVFIVDSSFDEGEQVFVDMDGELRGPYIYKGTPRRLNSVAILRPISEAETSIIKSGHIAQPLIMKMNYVFKIRLYSYQIPRACIEKIKSGSVKHDDKVMMALIDT